jgi:hypothetical protein
MTRNADIGLLTKPSKLTGGFPHNGKFGKGGPFDVSITFVTKVANLIQAASGPACNAYRLIITTKPTTYFGLMNATVAR